MRYDSQRELLGISWKTAWSVSVEWRDAASGILRLSYENSAVVIIPSIVIELVP